MNGRIVFQIGNINIALCKKRGKMINLPFLSKERFKAVHYYRCIPICNGAGDPKSIFIIRQASETRYRIAAVLSRRDFGRFVGKHKVNEFTLYKKALKY